MKDSKESKLEIPRNISAPSNSWIENYNNYRETGQLHILRQNPNLIVFSLHGSYHMFGHEKKR
jgi:hypothetical protein